ncbi:hypothetical protein C8T65DRAFT_737652 [Cerioporus squamosus]|nr:hypothetical protein C8T65DRAFT_737652 [Cerioporus squamosus]
MRRSLAERQAGERCEGGDRASAINAICARIVSYLLLHPVGDNPAIFVSEVLSENGPGDFSAKIYEIGKLYKDYVIPLFKQHKNAPSTPGEHPSRRSFDFANKLILEDSSFFHPPRLSMLRLYHSFDPCALGSDASKALIRDAYRCQVTNKVDGPSMAAGLVETAPSTITECAHIFSESLGFLESRDHEAEENLVATAYDTLNRFGYTGIQQELVGLKIHRLENVLTLDVLHRWFDFMAMWFEAIEGKPHTYRIETRRPFVPDEHFPREVTFTSTSENLPLPSPDYLRIHAACCRIAHLSGAAEYLGKIYRDEEYLDVLASDGTSAPVLDHLLGRLVSTV